MKNKKKIIWISTVVFVAALLTIILVKNKNTLPNISVEKALVQDIEKSVTVPGTIEPFDTQEILVSQNQKIKKLFFSEGQMVSAGQVIALLDKRDYENDLLIATLNKKVLENDLNKINNPKSDSNIRELEFSIEQSLLMLEALKLKLDDKTATYQNKEEQYSRGDIPIDELNKALIDVKDIQEQNKVGNNTLINYKNKLKDIHIAQSENIKAKKMQISLSDVEIVKINNKILDCEIKSNITGKIVDMHLKENEIADTTTNKILIHDISKYKFIGFVTQEDFTGIKVLQSAKVKVKGLDKDLSALVSKVQSVALKENSGTKQDPKIKIELDLIKSADELVSAFDADAYITIDKKINVLCVKKEAVKKNKDDKTYILSVQNGEIKKDIIAIGISNDALFEVTSGVNKDTVFVKLPTDDLKAGKKVIPILD
jgi:HlyD family secretion protein